MTRIDTESVLRNVELHALVSGYVRLRRAGTEYQGLCPFHQEKSPSFTVNVQKQFVHCFGCGAHHDAIGFVMAMTGKTFLEACAQLSDGEFSPARITTRRAM